MTDALSPRCQAIAAKDTTAATVVCQLFSVVASRDWRMKSYTRISSGLYPRRPKFKNGQRKIPCSPLMNSPLLQSISPKVHPRETLAI